MYPIGLNDIIEINIDKENDHTYSFAQTGIQIPDEIESNLCYKAWKLFCEDVKAVGVKLHLHKIIPLGAGLGGGSSNAATVLKGLNNLTGRTRSTTQLQTLASKLGSDCSFFIENKPCIAEGRGEILSNYSLDLTSYYLMLLNPGININTAAAYSMVLANDKRDKLIQTLNMAIESWKNELVNDFETAIFKKHPYIEILKKACYNAGAVYTSMSGSGASVYGIFYKEPNLDPELKKYILWQGHL
jgi:4-diphosphocytidyl-2-C-methyl-D-erythritol kinase